MNSLFKQIYRYTHARPLRHNENFWPYLKIRRSKAGHITHLTYRNEEIQLEDLESLRSKAMGDFTILATGPSINNLELNKISETRILGVNGSYHLRNKVKFSYYIIVDRGFIEQRFDMVLQVINDPDLIFFTTLHCLNDILKRTKITMIKCRLAIIEDLSYKVFCAMVPPSDYAKVYQKNEGLRLFDIEPASGFSWDIRLGFFDAGTVAYWALQLAVWLGADRLLLAGVDMNNFEKPRFYENDENKLPSLLATNFNNIIRPAFLNASRELELAGIKTYNLSLDSGLGNEIFEKATLDVIFKKA
ncbi:hypothetical protein HA48_03535 [Pantoea wallisii]|uniref:Sugar glycosyltransferase n=1 Tax=Pantoea wallisii TaxID=1076551 RepID=A0A1X1DCW1_9GAMM|nr:sugar glycosyltransferase [Pantoea wallisii]ORM74563.1 hypothetical protein HA48_03535 [Pantoea wallisii]